MKSCNRYLQAMLSLLLFAATASSALAADSRVYQWTDRNGVVHYSDTAEGGARSLKVKPNGSGLNAGVNGAAVDDEACARKREQLQRYSGATKVTETNALGETREYDEAQLKKLIESSEAAVRAACGDS